MRGEDRQQASVFRHVMPEQRVPRDHPLRPIREMVDEARTTVAVAGLSFLFAPATLLLMHADEERRA
jgi:hypothetical protein